MSLTFFARLVFVASLFLVACSSTTNGARDASSDAVADGNSDIVAIDVPGSCHSDFDCSDHVFCNGAERCMPGTVGADVRGCLPASPATPCPTGQACNEASASCAPQLCTPGQHRCDPVNPQQTQSCATDGSAWIDGVLCAGSVGMSCSAGLCVDRCNPTELNYLGCEFWPTVTVNSQLSADFSFATVLANPQTYPVNVSISGGALPFPLARTLAPGTVTTITLPWVQGLAQLTADLTIGCSGGPCIGTSAMVASGAYRVQADGPIAAYQFNPLTYQAGTSYSYTNDASLLLPTRALTSNYMVVAHDNWNVPDQSGNPTMYILGGFISIVGVDPTAAGTTVTVALTSPVRAGTGVTASGATTRTFTLHQGDVVQLVGATVGSDVTGTAISADHPVAVFTGNDCTNIPIGRLACDHVEEQLFPSETWGMHYVVTQLRDRGDTESSVIRIVSNHAALQLTFDGITAPAGCAGPLNNGQFCEFESTSSFQVSGSGPFLVMQFMEGQGPLATECNATPPPMLPQCMGDPASVTEVPVEQFRRAYDFFVPDTYVRNFVNVVMPIGSNIMLDGVALSAGTMASAGAGYQVVFVPVMPGPHHIQSDGAGFGIKVYGVAPYTSYMYPGGLDLTQISPPR